MADLTKRALEQALKDELKKKPFDDLTVTDLARDCGINRMTFYYHFHDIYDLVEWALVEDARKALGNNRTYETWEQGFREIFRYCLRNKEFICNVYHSVNHEPIYRYLTEVAYELVEGVVKEEAAGMDVSCQDQKFIADFYKYAFVGIVLDWVEHDMVEDPQQIMTRLVILTKNNIPTALKNFASTSKQAK
ncbi:MAG: TetR/AcrR family transcriptional regulator C-terminal domain-containing protein [Galactobacillus timonensis]|uniref:TetR/AcrR family transcriptional regulator n=1 Tax=Galactobacillus timonensis TaxID=2041840 RepID=UPI00240A5A02|nr:TetR/AcrR family transcriptional regulator [Galactobacillus timonensis]MDD6598901.1 TetR/AcrR family transcriptional regulator C-terminal domain-containing protein [Galactobacillus timonensis]